MAPEQKQTKGAETAKAGQALLSAPVSEDKLSLQSSSDPFSVFVNAALTGDRIATVKARPDDTVHTLRIAVQKQSSCSYVRLLLLNLTWLQESRTLRESGIDATASNLLAIFGPKAEWLTKVENGWGISAAPKELQSDFQISFAAVSRTGTALRQLTPEFRANPEIVLSAVQQDYRALQYASPELKADPRIVLAAVRNNSQALQYAQAELKADPQIVLAAARQNSQALRYAHDELKADPKFLVVVLREIHGCTPWWLKNVGFNLKPLKNAGFTLSQLCDAGFKADQFKDADIPLHEMKVSGCNARQLKNAGFSLKELKVAGFNLKELKAAGFNAKQLSCF